MRRRGYGRFVRRVVREAEAALDDSDEGEGDPRPLDALHARTDNGVWIDDGVWDGAWIEEYELRLAERLRVARERVSSRRARLAESGRAAGVTATGLEARATQAAALSPTLAARWVGVDIDILQCDEPRVWEAVQAPLRRFPAVVRRRITRARKAGEGGSDGWGQPLVSPQELNVLEMTAPELAEVVERLHEEMESRKTRLVSGLEQMAKRIQDAEDSPARRSLQTKLARELRSERVLDVLTRRQWIRLAGRVGGLGVRGDWRVRPPAESS